MYNINSIIIIKYTEIILINNLNKFHLFPFISSILFLIELITPNEGLSNLTKYDSKQLKPKVNGIITNSESGSGTFKHITIRTIIIHIISSNTNLINMKKTFLFW